MLLRQTISSQPLLLGECNDWSISTVMVHIIYNLTTNATYKSIVFNKTKRGMTLVLTMQIRDIYTYKMVRFRLLLRNTIFERTMNYSLGVFSKNGVFM